MPSFTKIPRAILVVAILPLFASVGRAQPNVTGYTPPGWTGPLVVTLTNGATVDGTNLVTGQTIYCDWSIINAGTSNATQTFQVNVDLDGSVVAMYNVGGLPADTATESTGLSLGTLSAGTHKLQVIADVNHVITGDNESDNTSTKYFVVGNLTLPAPSASAPANASTGQAVVQTFVWSAITNADYYRLLIASNAADLPSSATASAGGASVFVNAVIQTNSQFVSIALSPSTTYYWEAHGISTGGENGVWTGVQSFTTGPLGTGLTIVPTFDSTITSDPNAATIEATINAAIAVYRQNFSDSVTAYFDFVATNSGLGENATYLASETYSGYRSALVAHATTADDTTALAHISNTSTNPVNGSTTIDLKNPLARALGFTAPPVGGLDSTVYLNIGSMNLSSLSNNSALYSLFATVSHEMDEALGLGSCLNGLANGAATPTGAIQPEDLFRYDQNGNRSLTTSLSATSYFSLDGTNDLAQFNQFDGGDFGDWYSYNVTVTPQVQDAFLGPDATPQLGVELRVLDVIGYKRIVASAVAAPQISGITVSNGNCIFTLTGTVGTNYIVQASTNLMTWASISTNTIPAGGSLQVTNAVSTNNVRFFRAYYP